MPATDFGSRLREARERRGITLRQIADSTKIAASALEALERNDVSKLPGGIFSRAFVRSYAAAVGLDPELTVKEFLELFQGEPSPAATARPTTMSEDESAFESQQKMAAVVLTIVLISIPIAAAILYVTLRSRHTESPAPQAAVAASDRTLPAPGAAGKPGGPAAVPPAVPAASTTRAVTPPAATPGPREMTLEIHPTGPCWITVTVDGSRVLSRLMQAGETETLRVSDAAVIQVGDAGAFAFSIDGRPGLPLGAAGEVKTARITKDTAAQFVR